MHHGDWNDGRRGSRGATNSNVKTRGQRESRRERRLDRNLSLHLQLHDLGGMENTPLLQKARATLKSAGNGGKTR